MDGNPVGPARRLRRPCLAFCLCVILSLPLAACVVSPVAVQVDAQPLSTHSPCGGSFVEHELPHVTGTAFERVTYFASNGAGAGHRRSGRRRRRGLRARQPAGTQPHLLEPGRHGVPAAGAVRRQPASGGPGGRGRRQPAGHHGHQPQRQRAGVAQRRRYGGRIPLPNRPAAPSACPAWKAMPTPCSGRTWTGTATWTSSPVPTTPPWKSKSAAGRWTPATWAALFVYMQGDNGRFEAERLASRAQALAPAPAGRGWRRPA